MCTERPTKGLTGDHEIEVEVRDLIWNKFESEIKEPGRKSEASPRRSKVSANRATRMHIPAESDMENLDELKG